MTDSAATSPYRMTVDQALTNETWKTWANLVTTIRLVVGVVVFSFAAVERNEALNFIGLVDALKGRSTYRLCRLSSPEAAW